MGFGSAKSNPQYSASVNTITIVKSFEKAKDCLFKIGICVAYVNTRSCRYDKSVGRAAYPAL